jgi:hypothetical protein
MTDLVHLEGAAGALAAPVARNRRVSVRHLCRPRTAGRVAATRALVARSTPIHNLSAGGVALRLRRPLRRGSRLLIQLSHDGVGLAYDLSARVTHCTRQADGKWLVGCAFARELTPAELATLL